VLPNSGGGVTLIGHGYQGPDHYGLKDVTLDAVAHQDFHADPLPEGTLADRHETRFNTFHFDGIIYGSHPSRVTTFRCVQAPKGPDLTVRFDDGTGRAMKCGPGTTAFISTSQLYDSLTAEEKKLADNGFWEPAPHPFRWSSSRGIRSHGVGVVAPGGSRKTVPLDELPPWEPEKVHKYPLVWVNPVTGAKAFQVMPDIVRKLYFRNPKDGKEKVVEDEEEIRVFFNKIYDRFLDPEYILIPPCEEGSMVVWNNWVRPDFYNFKSVVDPRHRESCTVPSSIPWLTGRDRVSNPQRLRTTPHDHLY
jgi:alpha-ketoglutarate-dependent taurine dioxygenase